MKIMGFSGQAGAGKDTSARIVLQHITGSSMAFADPLRNAAAAMFGLTDEQMSDRILKEQVIPRWNKSPRQILQLLGTEAGRDLFGNDLWCKRAEVTVDWLVYMDRLEPAARDVLLFTDVRFADEAEWIRSMGGVVIDVSRPALKAVGIDGHRSAVPLPADCIDFTFNNFGTAEELELVVPAALSFWLNEATDLHVVKREVKAGKAA
jgi:hypothetical protein